MDFVLWQAGLRSLKGSHCVSYPCHCRTIWRTFEERLCNLYGQGERCQKTLFGWSSMCQPRKWFASRRSIRPTLIKSIKTSTLWHSSVRNPFAIDRSPVNQRFVAFSTSLLCSFNISISTQKKHISTQKVAATSTRDKKVSSLNN